MSSSTPHHVEATRESKASLVFLILILIATALVYGPVSLEGEFAYDDFRFIAENEGVHSLEAPHQFFLSAQRMTADLDRDIYRPLRTLAFAIDWAWGQGSPRIFHIINLGWHLLAIVLVYRLSRRLGLGLSSSLGVSGIFALHPIMSESVSFITSRGDLMASVFLLLLCLVYLGANGEPLRWKRGALLLFVAACSMLSKESGVIAPMLVASLAWWRVPLKASESHSKAARRLGDWPWVLALIGLNLVFVLVRGAVLSQSYPSQLPFETSSFLQRACVEAHGFWLRLRLMFWPTSLAIEHPLPTPWGAVSTGFTYLALVAAGTFTLCRRRPLAIFGFALFILPMIPTSHTLFGVKSVIAERFLYLSLLGVALILAGILDSRHPRLPRILLALLPLLGAMTWARNQDWMGQESLFTSLHQTYPESPHATLGLGTIAYEKGDFDQARDWFEQTLELTRLEDSRQLAARFHLGEILLSRQEYAAAVEILRPLLPFRDHVRSLNLTWFPKAMLVLADALSQNQSPQEAIEVLNRQIEDFGPSAPALAGLGQNLERLGEVEKALMALEQATSLAPNQSFYHRHLGLAYGRAGRPRDALRALRAASDLAPEDQGLRQLIEALERSLQ